MPRPLRKVSTTSKQLSELIAELERDAKVFETDDLVAYRASEICRNIARRLRKIRRSSSGASKG